MVKAAIGLQALQFVVIAVPWAAGAAWGRLPNSLIVSSVIFGPSLIFCAASVVGMVRKKMYGWILALVIDLLTCAPLAFFARPLVVFPLGMIGVLMLRGVREFYARNYYS